MIPAIGIGSALRSLAGIVPLICVLIVLSIYRATPSGIVRRLMIAILLFYTIEGIMADRRAVTTGNQIGDRDRLVADYLAEHGAIAGHRSLVMTSDPAQFSVTTGYPAVPMPNNGLQATQQAIRDFAPAFVLLNEEDGPDTMQTQMVAALKPVNAVIVPDTKIIVLTMAPQR